MVLGPRLRALRLEKGLSVRQLAAQVGVSAATISQVERDINDPSLSTLRRLARALETPLFDLFTTPGEVTHHVTRADERALALSQQGEVEYWRLSPPGAQIEVLEGILAPGASSSEEVWSHPAQECAAVITGTVVLELGTETHELKAGDSAYFDSRVPHRYVNRSRRVAKYIVSVNPPSY